MHVERSRFDSVRVVLWLRWSDLLVAATVIGMVWYELVLVKNFLRLELTILQHIVDPFTVLGYHLRNLQFQPRRPLWLQAQRHHPSRLLCRRLLPHYLSRRHHLLPFSIPSLRTNLYKTISPFRRRVGKSGDPPSLQDSD
ncbi:Uncharacterized protein HZ326_31123 [Fusarium oxysporum f. sp. albedinis]|nr:Uncharacterized protein HZ326_31123 [Fusarium oxysporum f. sp. albedinis]